MQLRLLESKKVHKTHQNAAPIVSISTFKVKVTSLFVSEPTDRQARLIAGAGPTHVAPSQNILSFELSLDFWRAFGVMREIVRPRKCGEEKAEFERGRESRLEVSDWLIATPFQGVWH